MSIVEELYREKKLDYIDLAVAEEILRGVEGEAALFLAHLSAAVRCGNLCVKVSGGGVFPGPLQCWRPLRDLERPLSEEEKRRLNEKIVAGAQALPEGLKGVCRQGELYYLQRTWQDEAAFIESYRNLAGQKPCPEPRGDGWEAALPEKMLPEQKEAVRLAMQKSLTIITGGPGTGKTFTAGRLIHALRRAFPERELKIALAAPTGKAAANLRASLGDPSMEAQTLHRLLRMRPSGREGLSSVDADLLLVDECSMIDAAMMRRLFSAVAPGARLILLGDRHQLPPIEAGSLFSDLAALHPDSVELKRCVRTELEALVAFGAAVKEGEFQKVRELLKSGSAIAYCASGWDRRQLVERGVRRFSPPADLSDSALLQFFAEFRILTPLRKGPFGTEALNRLFSERLRARAVPIMIKKNHPALQLFNGETGVLVKSDPLSSLSSKGDYALFHGRGGEGEVRRLPALLLPDYEEAYCLSIHKSQGSEYGEVLVLLPEGAQQFGRELLYTAVTRSRRGLELWASEDVLKETLSLRSLRLSGLQKSLSHI